MPHLPPSCAGRHEDNSIVLPHCARILRNFPVNCPPVLCLLVLLLAYHTTPDLINAIITHLSFPLLLPFNVRHISLGLRDHHHWADELLLLFVKTVWLTWLAWLRDSSISDCTLSPESDALNQRNSVHPTTTIYLYVHVLWPIAQPLSVSVNKTKLHPPHRDNATESWRVPCLLLYLHAE